MPHTKMEQDRLVEQLPESQRRLFLEFSAAVSQKKNPCAAGTCFLARV